MLKKTAHIILALLVFISTTGLTLSKHYCGDKLESVAVDSVPAPCCEMPGCCHNESAFYKVDDAFSITTIDSQTQVCANDLLFSATFVVLAHEIVVPKTIIFPLAESPPPLETESFLAFIQSYLC